MNKELSSFAARLRGTIANRQSAIGNQQFSELAHELFALQFDANPAYRRICEARQLTPKTIEHWTQVPFVPTSAFKELELSCIPVDERTAVFHSSGTTEQKPSRHFHSTESLAVYEASLWQWFKSHISVENEFVSLTPDQSVAPRSSLIHMFETIRRHISSGVISPISGNNFSLSPGEWCQAEVRPGVRVSVAHSNLALEDNNEAGTTSATASLTFYGNIAADGAWTINFDAVVKKLKSACDDGKPLTLLGTAFSFVHLLDFLAEKNLQLKLPAGSQVMETGGYKNRSRVLPKAELHALITRHLGIGCENIICEYGMSELSSQAYDSALERRSPIRREGGCIERAGSETGAPITRHFFFPPWARVQIISPETGREVADGETGLIRIFDLANVFSVAAIQTEDLGIRRSDGFELIGRAQFAEPRGCSLMSA